MRLLRACLLPMLVFANLTVVQSARATTLELIRDVDAPPLKALLLSTDIDVSVTGPIVRAVVTHRFRNTSADWMEGVYVFPLPESSAVDTLRMRVGSRFIEGELQERMAAQATYEAARAEGRRAAILEQNRSNVFQTSVANIGPGDVVVVQIEYQQHLERRDGVFSLRLPLVVTPRYEPLDEVTNVRFATNLSNVSAPDVGSPIRLDDQDSLGLHNPVEISIDLAPGAPLVRLESQHHEVNIRRDGNNSQVELTDPVPADRDFVLTWELQAEAEPQISVYSETVDGYAHQLIKITPPDAADMPPPPRDVVFIQDVSGSMSGTSIRQARRALEAALRRLRPQDRFNVIAFNDQFQSWARNFVSASPDEIERIVTVVSNLEANGGTDILPALEAGLALGGNDKGRVRQIILITDGAVGNENELLEVIEQQLATGRFFALGIGSAPNTHLMESAARIGRGAAVYIGDTEQVEKAMDALFSKLENPVMTDLRLDLPLDIDAIPARLPDLLSGEPLSISLRGPNISGTALLSGDIGGVRREIVIPLDTAEVRPGVARLFARHLISEFEIGEIRGAEPWAVEAAILDTSLRYGLVSRVTSLVAVDDAKITNAPLTRANIARNMPAGWDPVVFMPSEHELMHIKARGLSGHQAAAAPSFNLTNGPTVTIPKGSLGWRRTLLLGLALLAVGLFLFSTRRGHTA